MDHAAGGIGLELREGGEQLFRHLPVYCIALLRTGEDQPSNRTIAEETDAITHAAGAAGRPSFFARSSGMSSTMRSMAVENTLPCASIFNDMVPPPSSAPCRRKFSAWRLGSS